jgi:conjugative relaxase-like TrwC/TraI family protein
VLSIAPIGSSREEVSYYATLGREDYYAKGTEPPGVWWGEGAKRLGLEGRVETDAFRNLLLGLSPDGAKKLVQNARDPNRRSAFDLTFSVPKSVSALWGACGLEMRKQIEGASEKALEAVLQEFRKLCSFTRSGKAGERVEEAHPIAGVFRHETARAVLGELPDPNLHFHVVVLNAVLREDGRSGALDARPLFERHMKMALGALFRAELSKNIEELGVSSHRATKEVSGRKKELSWFELDGVPEQVIQEFSKRRAVIEAYLRKKGISGAKASELAALATREGKRAIPREELFAAWEKVAREVGLMPEAIHGAFYHKAKYDRVLEGKRAAERAVKRITDERAHFTEIELLRFTAEEA